MQTQHILYMLSAFFLLGTLVAMVMGVVLLALGGAVLLAASVTYALYLEDKTPPAHLQRREDGV